MRKTDPADSVGINVSCISCWVTNMPDIEASQSEGTREIPIELWADELHRICGNFQPEGISGQKLTSGRVSMNRFHGVEVAQVLCDLPALMRSKQDISNETQDFMFLIMQTTGSCTIRQGPREILLEKNGLALVDSSLPVNLQFGQGMSNQLSFHLPKDHFEKLPGHSKYALGLDGSDPRASTIVSFLNSMFLTDGQAAGSYERQYVLENLAMIAFLRERSDIDPHMALYRRAVAEIKAGFRDPELTPSELAQRLGEPLRSVQLAFQKRGDTISEMINRQRLRAFQSDLEQSVTAGRRPAIATMALNAGFNDVSYFNRRYRSMFGMSPRQYSFSKA